MRKLILLVFCVTLIQGSWGLSYSTTNLTPYIHVSVFTSLSGWNTSGSYNHNIQLVNVDVDGVATQRVCLRALANCNSLAQLQLFNMDTAQYFPVYLIDTTEASTGPVGIPTDALIFKIRMKSYDPDRDLPGSFAVVLQNGLALRPDKPDSVYNIGGFSASPNGCLPRWSWTTLSLVFTPQNPLDWWQIRNINLMYSVNQTDKPSSGIIIDKIELYGITVNPE